MKNITEVIIDSTRCVGCGRCKKSCLEGAIKGDKKKLHVIDANRCTRCGLCYYRCRHNAIRRSQGLSQEAL